MPLTLGPLLIDADIDPARALVIRHAYVRERLLGGQRPPRLRLHDHMTCSSLL